MTQAIMEAMTGSGTPDLAADLKRARWLATWLDAKFSILGFRFGLDGLIGLVPVAGDTLGALAGLYPLYVANRHGFGKVLQVKMAANLGAKWATGLLPVGGAAANAFFKANMRNVRLLEEAALARGHKVVNTGPGVTALL